MVQIKIGTLIAELRKEKQLTQEQLVEKSGVFQKSISRWENGKIDIREGRKNRKWVF